MKTVMIWNDGDNPIRFAILDGDYRHMDRVYVNASGDDEAEAKQEQLSDIVYDNKGRERLQFKDEFPVEAVKQGAYVIVAGFLQ
jgi:hypothetical protein